MNPADRQQIKDACAALSQVLMALWLQAHKNMVKRSEIESVVEYAQHVSTDLLSQAKRMRNKVGG